MHVSVIIPVWNGEDVLAACLQALRGLDDRRLEVIAVDNASQDGSVDIIQDHSEVLLLRNEANLGFAGACNVGMRHARGDILVLLNQDTEVRPGWLEALVTAMAMEPDVGIAGCKALYPDGTLQHAGGYLDPQVGGRHYGYGERDTGQYEDLRDVDFVSGVALALSRQAYGAVGGLDEGFRVAYFEDVDLCYRVRAAGFRVVYVPQAVLVHREESALADGSYAGIRAFQENRLRLLLRHWPLARLRDEFAPTESAWLLRQLSAEFIAAVHGAYMTHLRRLPEIARWRREYLLESPAVTEELTELLLALRLIYPLRPVDPDWHGVDVERNDQAEPLRSRQLLRQAAELSHVRGQPFRSNMPLLGPLIAWMRDRWNNVAARWYIDGALEQQNAFNESVLAMLEHLDERNVRLADVLLEYVRESAREIDELSAQVRRIDSEQDVI